MKEGEEQKEYDRKSGCRTKTFHRQRMVGQREEGRRGREKERQRHSRERDGRTESEHNNQTKRGWKNMQKNGVKIGRTGSRAHVAHTVS